jgi:EcoRII C terminal
VGSHAKRRPGVRASAVLGSAWVDEVRETIPTVSEQIEAGLAEIRRQGFAEDSARAEFGKWLVSAHRAVEHVYRTAEAAALSMLVDKWVESSTLPVPSEDVRIWLREFLSRAARDFTAFEFRAGQSRKSRAGSVWETLGGFFLEWSGIRSEKPTGQAARKLRQIDKVVPSVAVALATPDRAIRLSFKTEAREKWRVLIDEGRRGYVYLVTLGDDITPARLEEMADTRLVAFVPKNVKEGRPEFRDNPSIRVLDELPDEVRRYDPRGPTPTVPPTVTTKPGHESIRRLD